MTEKERVEQILKDLEPDLLRIREYKSRKRIDKAHSSAHNRKPDRIKGLRRKAEFKALVDRLKARQNAFIRRINSLVKEIRELQRRLREFHLIFKREMRKQATRYMNLEKKYNELKAKKPSSKTIVYRNVYKTYEPTTAIKKFESLMEDYRGANYTCLEHVEYILKLEEFYTTRRKNHQYDLSPLKLKILLVLVALDKVVSVKTLHYLSVNNPSVSRALAQMEEIMLVRTPKRGYYEATALGKELMSAFKHYMARGTSSLLEGIKKQTGLVNGSEEENFEDYLEDEI